MRERGIENEMESERNTHNLGGKHQRGRVGLTLKLDELLYLQ